MIESVDDLGRLFSNSLLALQTFLRSPNQFDFVFTDYNMSGLNGIRLALEMRAIRKDRVPPHEPKN